MKTYKQRYQEMRERCVKLHAENNRLRMSISNALTRMSDDDYPEEWTKQVQDAHDILERADQS